MVENHHCSEHFRTLCSKCSKCTDLRLCGWTGKLGTLPPGAEAEEHTLRESGKNRISYGVIRCPNFERGRARSADDPAPVTEKPRAFEETESYQEVRKAAEAVEPEKPVRSKREVQEKPRRKYVRKLRQVERIRDKTYDEWRMLINIMEVAAL